MILERDACYRALQARDARFDGRFFVAVRTTGIYCRPICPARTPKLENIDFYASAAAAQAAGFRACLRCRPESSPQLSVWRGTASTVTRALALIAKGALDGDDADVEALAARVGIGERQLRRLFEKHLGASPIAVAQTRRVHFAKQLIHETRLSMTDVAMASGFGSVRRFNDTFRRLYGRAPSTLRGRQARVAKPGRARSGMTLLLSYAPPYDWSAMIASLAAHAIPGLEAIERSRYRRTVALAGHVGMIQVEPAAARAALAVTIHIADVKLLPMIVERLRRMFDLGADPGAIAAVLREDRHLAPLVDARPGLRVPGAWDGFEQAVRAMLAEVHGVDARDIARKLVAAYGEPLERAEEEFASAGLDRAFPAAERLAGADLDELIRLGLPRGRAGALRALAAIAAADASLFDRERDLDDAVARFKTLPGIGEESAHLLAMCALREPDAFPAGDPALLDAIALLGGTPTPEALGAHAERWRPWRAYAAQHLWTAPRERAHVPHRSRRKAVA